jgi:hypothetical protein
MFPNIVHLFKRLRGRNVEDVRPPNLYNDGGNPHFPRPDCNNDGYWHRRAKQSAENVTIPLKYNGFPCSGIACNSSERLFSVKRDLPLDRQITVKNIRSDVAPCQSAYFSAQRRASAICAGVLLQLNADCMGTFQH